MKIGLIDVDSHNYPNLPLMKLSAFHKAQGDSVEWYHPFTHFDKVYLSKVFTDTPDYNEYINADVVVRGGTGYAIHGAGGYDYHPEEDHPLPDEVEHIYPDYSLYGITDTAYGFLSRGCPRGCGSASSARRKGYAAVKWPTSLSSGMVSATSSSTTTTYSRAPTGQTSFVNWPGVRQWWTSTKDWMPVC